MMSRPLASTLAALLIGSLVTPATFFAAPPKAHAIFGMGDTVIEVGQNLYTNLKTTVESTITAIKSTLIEVHAATSAAAEYAGYINTYVLQPLAFVLSGNLMKLLTAGVIAFVIGKANGTGVPQFVVDVQKSLQTVADSRALAYLNSFGKNSNSPFAASISSSLRKNYLNKTSLAGMWAANMCTLSRTSPNINSYLAGNWSQGGVATWFALTTQTQNNPYMLYQNSESQLAAQIGPGSGGVTGTRISQLNWGQGFMSWCGATQSTSSGNASSGADASEAALTGETAASATQSPQSAYQACQARGGTGAECQAAFDAAGGTMPPASTGVNPGDPCVDTKTGNAGTIKTPGSVIVATLNKVLGGQQDEITRMGNVGPEITGILSDIGTVMKTVNFAVDILGNASLSTATGGLLGADDTSATQPTSRLIQYQSTPGYLGVTNSNVYKNASTPAASGSDAAGRVSQFKSSWDTLVSFTKGASGSLISLSNACPAQAGAAQSVLTNTIGPILTRADTASTTAAATTAMIQRVQNELNAASSDAEIAAYRADNATLQQMPPSADDVAAVQKDVQATSGATASPASSLNVSGGSLLDQLGLINTNAQALQAACIAAAPATTP